MPAMCIISAAEPFTKSFGLRADDKPTMWDEANLLIFEAFADRRALSNLTKMLFLYAALFRCDACLDFGIVPLEHAGAFVGLALPQGRQQARIRWMSDTQSVGTRRIPNVSDDLFVHSSQNRNGRVLAGCAISSNEDASAVPSHLPCRLRSWHSL